MATILSTSAFLQTPPSLSSATPLKTQKPGVFSLSFRNSKIGVPSKYSNLLLSKSNASTLEVSRFIPSAVYQQTSEVEEEAKEEKTGSVEFQVLCFTNKIRSLTSHLQIHRKDYSSQRGLRLTLGKRQRLLAYLAKKDARRYQGLIGKLDIRDPKKTRATLN